MLINRKAGEEYGLFRYAVLYSELKGRLAALRNKHPECMRFDSIGKTNEGRDIILVYISENVTDSAVKEYEAERAAAFNSPDEYCKIIDKDTRCKLPIMINCNLHGSEISGTDGMLTFIEELLSSDLKKDLAHCTILISICMNPDGRSRGFDILNGHGVDMNRDWMAQTQPEVRALITGIFNRFYPAILVDMHGFMSSGNVLIDACTPPHNPFFEYDLLEKHLIEDSKAMAAVIGERLSIDVDIPALVWKDGWEDYSPIYTPVFFLSCGTIAHTLETNFPSEEGAMVTHCAAIGVLNYVRDKTDMLIKNQCEIFSRGIHNTPHSFKTPNFYRIPVSGQRDLSVVYDTVNLMRRNGVKVCTAPNGDFVVPAAQPLRTLVHNMLWQGEDTSEKIDSCYDISFYSYPIMRGFNCEELDCFEESLTELSGPIKAKYTRKALDENYAVSCETNESVILINALIREGFCVTRECLTGNFYVSNELARAFIEEFSIGHDIRICKRKVNTNTVELDKTMRILTVADSGAVDELLCELGFDSEFLLFSELNRGYKIDTDKYDVLVVGGTDLALWNDVFDDVLGNSYQTSWALRERGRNELIRAAKVLKNRVMYGFAGMKINEAVQSINYKESEHKKLDTATGEQTAENWML
ncbi:MAG: M14 family zinc carboxypeptidase, partial [Oscillospiraceae bacterium]